MSLPPSSPLPLTRLTPEQVVQEVRDLPAAPKVLPKLKRLLSDGNSSISEIVAFLRVEPGIVARVLQVANSAYYCKGNRCSAVEDAVGRVGYDQVYEMVMYAVASQVLERPLATYRLEADELWRFSVAGGVSAELLADLTGQPRDTAYTLGLLHTVGMVAVDAWAARHNGSLVMTPKAFPLEYTQSERTLIGFTHAEVGAVLMSKWDFPREMCEAFRWQYSPPAAGGATRLASLLYAAKWLRSSVCPEVLGPPESLTEDFLRPLRIDVARLSKLTEEVAARLEDLKKLLTDDDSEEKK